ncbi:ThiF family adenylyltransferase [Erythrobacter sp.]|uniref:ThiF family adenylyltransferase n=1 Tax=Erythrobacter sp. TaxID=1042 RepID=UPI001B106E16|nr:ThiF family adenylyltransferase [Erythrobacter sp.]MBO6526411.1 ThiF family adenylyltransferase [Erythrobacter sp.]MBO6530318.1 ThiF family adenylyltransferase [Erythrobacter sp.]
MGSALRILARDHQSLRDHVFPGDGKEAAAILVCTLCGRNADRLLVRSIIPVPHQVCSVRTSTRLSWPGEYLEKAVDAADEIGGSILLMHSHPGGLYGFSEIDNESDAACIPSLQHGVRHADGVYGSAIMIPDGRVKARLYDSSMNCTEIPSIVSIGHDVSDLTTKQSELPMAFSSAMGVSLSRKTAVVVGVSGTGSITAELLGRLGVGRIILVDFDRVEEKNLNRILYATPADIGRYKTHVLRDAIQGHHPETIVETYESPLADTSALDAVSDADVMFSCVDSMEGRYHCDLVSHAFLCPLIDVGVVIPTRRRSGNAEIADVCGRVDFIRPGGPGLWDRGEITGEGLSAEYLRHSDPKAYAQQLDEGYVKGVVEEAPSVISLNMRAASAGVNEWIARLFPFRHEPNEGFARTYFTLAGGEEESSPEPSISAPLLAQFLGCGLSDNLLNRLGISSAVAEAA